MNVKKISCLILSLCFIITAMVSCGGEKTKEDELKDAINSMFTGPNKNLVTAFNDPELDNEKNYKLTNDAINEISNDNFVKEMVTDTSKTFYKNIFSLHYQMASNGSNLKASDAEITKDASDENKFSYKVKVTYTDKDNNKTDGEITGDIKLDDKEKKINNITVDGDIITKIFEISK